MTGRTVLGVALAGLAMFIWGFISHVVLGLGEAGIQNIPNESAMRDAVRTNVQQPGFYMIPGMPDMAGQSKEAKDAAQKEWEDKYRAGPSGLLILQRNGLEAMDPAQLLTELASNIGCALVAALLLMLASRSLASLGSRVVFVALLGLFAHLSIEVSYWNWYGFPTTYMLAMLADQVIGAGIMGVVLALMVKPPAA